jgi:hypothetical protein
MLSNHDVKTELKKIKKTALKNGFQGFQLTSFSIRLHTTFTHQIALEMMIYYEN